MLNILFLYINKIASSVRPSKATSGIEHFQPLVCEIVVAVSHDVLVRKIVDELFEKNVLDIRREKFQYLSIYLEEK